MNFIKYFFSEIFRLFKLLVGIALVLAAGFLIYKLFFSEPVWRKITNGTAFKF